MPKINVYLPDTLAAAVKDAGVPVSAVCQAALSEAVERIGRARRAVAALRDPATPAAILQVISRVTQDRMTARLTAALQAAATDPDGQARDAVSSLDLLRGLLGDSENLAVRLMITQGADLDTLGAAAAAGGSSEAPPPVAGPRDALLERLTMPARLACAAALEAVVELGHNYIGCEHLLIGLAASDGPAHELLAGQGIAAAPLRQALTGAAAGIIHERNRPAEPSAGALADVMRRLEAIELRLAGPAQP